MHNSVTPNKGFQMPSVKPRLALTLPQHRYDLLKRLGELTGSSMASTVTELLDECYPVLERVVMALEVAKNASESAKAGFRESCDKAIQELEPYRDVVSNQFDLFMDEVTKGNSGVEMTRGTDARERAGGRDISNSDTSTEGLNPRVVTRGSGFPTPPPKTQVKKPRKAHQKGNTAK